VIATKLAGIPAKAGNEYATASAFESLTLWDTGFPPSRGCRPISWLSPRQIQCHQRVSGRTCACGWDDRSCFTVY